MKLLFRNTHNGYGDMIWLSPILRFFKRMGAENHVAIKSWEILEGNPNIDVLYHGWAPGAHSFSMCLDDIGPHIPMRVAAGKWDELHEALSMHNFLNCICRYAQIPLLPEEERYAEYFYLPEEVEWVEALWKERIDPSRAVIALGVDSTSALRSWPEDCQLEFLEVAQDEGWQVVLLGGTSRYVWPRSAEHFAVPQLPHLHDLRGKTTLRQACAIVHRADALVSTETSFLHVGVAVGQRCVGLLTEKYASTLFPKWTELQRFPEPAGFKYPCWPCNSHVPKGYGRACLEGNAHCLHTHSAVSVAESLRELLVMPRERKWKLGERRPERATLASPKRRSLSRDKLRIGIFTAGLDTGTPGGAEKRMAELMVFLQRRGHEVWVLARSGGPMVAPFFKRYGADTNRLLVWDRATDLSAWMRKTATELQLDLMDVEHHELVSLEPPCRASYTSHGGLAHPPFVGFAPVGIISIQDLGDDETPGYDTRRVYNWVDLERFPFSEEEGEGAIFLGWPYKAQHLCTIQDAMRESIDMYLLGPPEWRAFMDQWWGDKPRSPLLTMHGMGNTKDVVRGKRLLFAAAQVAVEGLAAGRTVFAGHATNGYAWIGWEPFGSIVTPENAALMSRGQFATYPKGYPDAVKVTREHLLAEYERSWEMSRDVAMKRVLRAYVEEEHDMTKQCAKIEQAFLDWA
jgi:ADP-heptose:LPS heptosyltransferase